MNKFFCCLTGKNQVVEDPPDDPQQQQQAAAQHQPQQLLVAPHNSPETIGSSENHDRFESNVENPFGDNEFLNYYVRNKLELPDDRVSLASSSYLHLPSPPPLSYSGITYRWVEILNGTQNFRQSNLLGEGTFGKVYRCHLSRDNLVAAAKVQNLEHQDAHAEFAAEVTTLYRARHPNVVKLIGKCFGRTANQRVIVYEYMPKGSLDRYLLPQRGLVLPREAQRLDWNTRMRIAVGVAKALVYLHNDLKVIHRDVKVSNVLLNENFEPKLADFGSVTGIVTDENGEEDAHVMHPIKGTLGYMPTETEFLGVVSTKTDVYAYGIFLFQLITGKIAWDPRGPPEARYLTDWLVSVWSSDEDPRVIVDPALSNRFPVEGLTELVDVARSCIEPMGRPDMVEVEQMVRAAATHSVPSLSESD